MTTKTWKLQRTTQCAKCPWRKDVDPNDIPGGYSQLKHCNLESTIAQDPLMSLNQSSAMACHESTPGQDLHCIGWLMQQAGPGNNLAVRLRLMSCENADKITLIGEQHDTFEDTLPGPARALLTIKRAEEIGYELFDSGLTDEDVAKELCEFDRYFEDCDYELVVQWVAKARELYDVDQSKAS